MAKRRKPTIGEVDQMNKLIESMESYSKHKVECFLCLERESDRDITEARFARDLYAKGWRVIRSDKYQTIGVACPECAGTPDKDR